MIKEVKLSDLNQIFNLEQDIFKQDAFSKDTIKKLIQRNLFFLKIENGGKFFGFIIVIKDIDNRANLINLIINPLYQNQGKGSLLLEKTIKEIKELNEINEIVLNVKVSNKIAIKLYEKFGFKTIERIKNYYQSSDSEAYLMKLKIHDKKEC